MSVHAQSINIIRTLLRETVGRILCLGTAFLGYASIVFRNDGRGLHDFLSGSIVISEKRHQTSILRFAGILFAVVMMFSFSVYYTLFKTPILATVGMHILNSNGMEIGSLTGNIEKGWKIDSFYGSNAVLDFSVKGIHIKHSSSGFFHRGAWRVNTINIDEIKIRLAPNTLNFNYFERTPLAMRNIPQDQAFRLFKFRAFVDAVKIKIMTISDSEKLNLVFSDTNAAKMSLENNIFNLESINNSQTSTNKLEVSQLVYNLTDQKLLAKGKLLVRKDAYSVLKKDLEVSFSWSGSVRKPERFRLLTFEDRFSVDFFRNDLLITLRGFSPAAYIKASPTFKNINVKWRNSNCLFLGCLKSLQGSGSFFVSGQKIEFKNNSAWFVGTNEEVLPFNYNELVKALFSPRPILSVVSEETVSNFVSQLYYKKPMDQLLEQEQGLVKRDSVYFKILRERFDPNRPRHIDTFLLRSPAELSETK